MIDNVLGKKITTLRYHHGRKKISLHELADAVGVSKGHIWEIENGKVNNPSVFLMQKIAFHFGISMESLLNHLENTNAVGITKEALFAKYSALTPKNQKRFVELLDIWNKPASEVVK